MVMLQGILLGLGTSGPWTRSTNYGQFAFPDYTPLMLALCSQHP